MQAARKAVETIKETAANIGASAKSGLEKTKATVQEKNERMSASDPMQKEMATDKKEERIHQAEMEKQEARDHNAKMSASVISHVTEGGHPHTHTTTGPTTETATGYSTIGDYGSGQSLATDHSSTTPGLGYGLGLGHGLGNEEVVMGSHPIETNTGIGGKTKAHSVRVHGTAPGSGPTTNN